MKKVKIPQDGYDKLHNASQLATEDRSAGAMNTH